MRLGRSLILIGVVVVVSAAVASAVTYVLVGRDSVAHAKALPPIALVGILRDTSGKPVANAWVQLTTADSLHAKTGQRIPIHELAGVHTDAVGRFIIRQSQLVPIIRKLLAENATDVQGVGEGGFVNFDVMIRRGQQFDIWAVPRDASHHLWFADEFGTPATSKVERITYRPFNPRAPAS